VKSLKTLFKNAYGGLSKEVWLLALTQFINRSGTMVVFFLSVYLKEELHFSLTRVGIAMALFGAGSVLGVFIGGRLADKMGPYKVMRWSLLSGGFMFIIVSQLENFYALCAGLFLLSTIADIFRPANMAAVFHYSTPATYTRSVTLNRLAINLGFSLGPALGGFLAAISYKLIFIADGVTCILASLLIVFFLKEKIVNSKEDSGSQSAQAQSPWKDKVYLLFLPLSVIYAMTFFQFFSTMQLYYKEVEHLTEWQIGGLLALNGLLVAAIEMIMIFKIEKKTSMYNFIAIGASLLVLSYVLLVFVSGWWWMIALTIIISFSEMFAMPFMNALMNARASAASKGQYASLYGMSWSAGQILIPLLATQTIQWLGYTALWVVLAILASMVVLGIKQLEKKTLLE
jgi:predicted MFS family arabinose efflux permease